jgi:hypothetical protein
MSSLNRAELNKIREAAIAAACAGKLLMFDALMRKYMYMRWTLS